jgi:hypothetical protein
MYKVMTCGKYKDKPFNEIPIEYLEWFVSNASYDNIAVARDVRDYLNGQNILNDVSTGLLTKGEYTLSREAVGAKSWSWIVSNIPLAFRNKSVTIIKRKDYSDELLVLKDATNK